MASYVVIGIRKSSTIAVSGETYYNGVYCRPTHMKGTIERTPLPVKETVDRSNMIITMDGSTTAGKRIVSERLADRYNLTILNTGVSIRSLALLAIENGLVRTDNENVTTIPVDFAERVVKFYDNLKEPIRIEKPKEGSHTARIMVGDRDMLGELITYPKKKAVDNLGSIIAASPAIRWKMYQLWRSAVSDLGGCVVVGRKTGLDLFPDAQVKLYLYASPVASAAYRVAHDPTAHSAIDTEQRYILERDARDARSGLLDRPVGGLILDTSDYIQDNAGIVKLENKIADYIDRRYIIK